jgi:hypothetical protein
MPQVLDRDRETITRIDNENPADTIVGVFLILSLIAMIGFMIYAFNHDSYKPDTTIQGMPYPLTPQQTPTPAPLTNGMR